MNIVTGTVLAVNEPIFTNSFRRATLVGHREFIAKVVSDDYGAANKHWFSIEILENCKNSNLEIGKKYRRQGKNLYNNSEILSQPEDVAEKTEIKAAIKRVNETVCAW